jgi:hypothetical protein
MRRSSRPQRSRRPRDDVGPSTEGDEGDTTLQQEEEWRRRSRQRRTEQQRRMELLVTRDLRKLERHFDSPTSFRCLPCAALSEWLAVVAPP